VLTLAGRGGSLRVASRQFISAAAICGGAVQIEGGEGLLALASGCKREDFNVLPLVLSATSRVFTACVPLVVAAATTYFESAQGPVTQSVTQDSESNLSEPMFNVPFVVVVMVGVLILVHILHIYVLSDAQNEQFIRTFAFIPARYDSDFVEGSLPGGFGAELWTFFTYAFIHANFLHLGFNLAWLLPFGTALARRFGAWRYGVFMLVMAAAGALAHLVTNLGATVPMIGASAAVSGAMAAALRFVFQQDGPAARWRENSEEAYRVPAASLAATLGNPRFLMFLAVWLGLNALFGYGTISFGQEAGEEIAWQAHVGGFFAGLFLFNAFDPVVPGRDGETTATG
jgi:membrane associated rhomboid family serine protease